MTIKLYAMTCGWLDTDAGGMLEGESGRLKLPVPSFLIVHPKGKVIFDTGLHTDLQSDPSQRLGKRLSEMFRPDYSPGQEVGARLEALEIDRGEIRYVVNSHLHFDHVGGNAQIPNARVVVQRLEWEAAGDPDLARKNAYNRADFDLGHELLLIDGEHDLFGDRSVVCIPTYGHTPGHQSLRVRTENGEAVLTADACYLRKTIDDLHLPPFAYDKAAMIESLKRLRELAAHGAKLFYGHDPEFWRSVPQAPAPVD